MEVIQQNGVDPWTGIFQIHTAGIKTQACSIPLWMVTGLNGSTSVHAGCPKTELAIWGPQPRLPPFQHRYSWDTSALVIGLDSHIVEWVEPDCGGQHFMSFRAEDVAQILHIRVGRTYVYLGTIGRERALDNRRSLTWLRSWERMTAN